MTPIRARVAAVHRASLQLLHAGALVPATLSTSLVRSDDPLDRPGVGDWVTVEVLPDGTHRITGVEPRHSALVRRAAGERVEPQLLAANFDVALCFAPLPDDVNPRRLARLAALAWNGGATPLVVISRTDMVEEGAVADALRQVHHHLPGVDVIAVSSVVDHGLDPLRAWMRPGSTLVLLGPSGAGKSTLVNRLAGAEVMETGSNRSDGGGRHTTTHRALISLPDDVTIIDTPGLREIGMWVGSAGSEHVFADIVALAEGCRFGDCAHLHEPGCAVRGAVESGALDADRYEQWLQLQRESARAERSVHEQRRVERVFGKLVKQFYKSRDS